MYFLITCSTENRVWASPTSSTTIFNVWERFLWSAEHAVIPLTRKENNEELQIQSCHSSPFPAAHKRQGSRSPGSHFEPDASFILLRSQSILKWTRKQQLSLIVPVFILPRVPMTLRGASACAERSLIKQFWKKQEVFCFPATISPEEKGKIKGGELGCLMS